MEAVGESGRRRGNRQPGRDAPSPGECGWVWGVHGGGALDDEMKEANNSSTTHLL